MNVSANTSIGNGPIQARETQQQSKKVSQANPPAAKQSDQKVADRVSISAKGNEAKQINPTVNPSMGEAKTASEAKKTAAPAAARILGTNLVV